MTVITREEMAKMLIQQAEENGGALGVAVLEDECQKYLNKSRLQGLRSIVQKAAIKGKQF